MSNVNGHLARKLRELRGERTIYQLAKESGIDRTQLSRYESGRIPEDEILEKLAHYYKVPYAVLKQLSFEDLFPEGSRQRVILLAWAEQILRTQAE